MTERPAAGLAPGPKSDGHGDGCAARGGASPSLAARGSGPAPSRRAVLAFPFALALADQAQAEAPAAPPAPAVREVPARPLPAPETVSPQIRPIVAAPPAPGWDVIPQDAAAWIRMRAETAAAVAPHLAAIRKRLGVTVESWRLGGVNVIYCTPTSIPPENRDRVLLHLHGGAYVLFPGEAGAGEGMMMAGYGRFRVVSVDYRMPPEHPFPAALDDTATVWRELTRVHDPRRMGVFGSSAGGALVLSLMLKAKAERLPLPAAIGCGAPWADLAARGDSINASAFVDNVLVSQAGWIGAAAKLYAAGRDLNDPLLSPINGDFSGLPPAILTTGTRDLLLSDTVRVHRKLRKAGVEASLQVFEGLSHGQFLLPFMPETEEAFAEITAFMRQKLAR